MPQKRTIKRTCLDCGIVFYATSYDVKIGRAIFCSYKCVGNNKKKSRIKKRCLFCNKEFLVKRYRKDTAKTCSRKCLAAHRHYLKGKHSPSWKGGRKKKGDYILIHSPNHPFSNTQNYAFEHRLVMEEKIGRYLLPSEVVHHINGIKDDNRPENLKLFSDHSTHIKYERSIINA